MAEWRTWDPSNEQNTCLWCGRPLRFQRDVFDAAGQLIADRNQRPKHKKGGDYSDGFFCGLRCGYQFGVEMAKFGRRLQPRKTSEK